jgi:hypothetical protein
MARIDVNDLPAAQGLPAEQEELIQGAGLRPFRPTLEGLEDRQMPDAGLGHTLLPALAPAAGAHAPGQAQEVAPPMQVHIDPMVDGLAGHGEGGSEQGQQLAGEPSYDVDKAVKYVVDTFKEKVFNNQHNAWGIKSVALIGSEASENTLIVKMHLEFNPGLFTTDPPADLAIKFSYHTRHRGEDHKWFLCEGTNVTVNGKRDFNHMGMETATNWVLGAFDAPSAKVEGQASDRLAAPDNPERVAHSVFQQFNQQFVNNGVNVWGLRAASYEGLYDNGNQLQVVIKLAFADGKTASLGINLLYQGRVFGTDVFRCNGTGVVRDGQVTHDYWALQVATEAKFLVTTVPASTQASTATPFAPADAYFANLRHPQGEPA